VGQERRAVGVAALARVALQRQRDRVLRERAVLQEGEV
jgi:hypothetical protein